LSGHTRLAPHVSEQAQDRAVGSALRFSPPARVVGGCSALRFSQPESPEASPMPFRRKGTAALTMRLDVRVAPDEKDQIRDIAVAAGRGVSELVRLRVLGRPVICRTDATTIRELRRLGGLLKKVHVDSGGAYSQQTAAALRALHAAIARLAGHEHDGAP
jgi:mobilization protein NikA